MYPKFYYCVANINLLVSSLSQINPISILSSYYLKAHFKTTIPFKPRTSKWSLSYSFSQQYPVYMSLLPLHLLHVPTDPPSKCPIFSRHPLIPLVRHQYVSAPFLEQHRRKGGHLRGSEIIRNQRNLSLVMLNRNTIFRLSRPQSSHNVDYVTIETFIIWLRNSNFWESLVYLLFYITCGLNENSLNIFPPSV